MAKKYVNLNNLSTFLISLRQIFSEKSHKHNVSDITDYVVDSSLSNSSVNPVQNRVIDAEFEAVSNAMSALELAINGKSDTTHKHDGVYDTKGAAATVQQNLDAVSDEFNDHKGDSNIHVTAANKTNWGAAYTHSQSSHARVDATKVSDSTTNGNILINGTETNVYSHPNSGVSAGTYKSVTVNAQGHVTAGSNPTTLSGYGITDAETKTDASAKLAEAKSYADSAADAVKNDLLNGAGTAYDTLKELGELIDDNKDAIEALEDVAAGKADKVHTHAISDITNLQSTLDGKAAASHGTHVTYSTTAPVMDGTASVGSASTVARSDHKHPTDTSRAAKTDLDSHTGNTTVHITSTERTNWNAAKTHADSAHAPSNAEKNQNAFSNIAVSGQTTVAADTATDTVTFAGSNVTITTDATNDKVTFAVADGTTSVKGVVKLEDSVTSTSTTTAATPKSVKSAYDLASTANTAAGEAKNIANTKAASSHTHAVSDVTGLQTTLDSKATVAYVDETVNALPIKRNSWELIQSFTVSEEVSYIYMDTTKGGTALSTKNYTKLYLFVTSVEQTTEKTGEFFAYINVYSQGADARPRASAGSSFIKGATKRCWQAIFDIDNGLCLFGSAGVADQGWSGPISSTPDSYELFTRSAGQLYVNKGYVNNVKIKSNVGIPAGTQIKIWAR